MVDPDSIPRLMAADTIEVAPLAYMRGRTLNDSFIILDEAQNTSPEQMKMFLTRLGFGSKVVVTGDVTQVDLPSGQTSGLRVVQDILEGVEDIDFCLPEQPRRRPAQARHRHRRRLQPLGRDARARVQAGRGRRVPQAGAAVSIEVLNESGVPVDETSIAALSRHVLDGLRVHPSPSCRCCWSTRPR